MVETVQRSEPGGLERVFRLADRVAGGRSAAHRVPGMRDRPSTRCALAAVGWLLAAELVVGLAALVVAVAIELGSGRVGLAVWLRCCVVLGITVTLFYFLFRARLGYRWAYSRLRLFSLVFPVVTLVLCAIPGLYPLWMIVEQLLFSAILVAIAIVLCSARMREAFPRPPRAVRGKASHGEPRGSVGPDQVVR